MNKKLTNKQINKGINKFNTSSEKLKTWIGWKQGKKHFLIWVLLYLNVNAVQTIDYLNYIRLSWTQRRFWFLQLRSRSKDSKAWSTLASFLPCVCLFFDVNCTLLPSKIKSHRIQNAIYIPQFAPVSAAMTNIFTSSKLLASRLANFDRCAPCRQINGTYIYIYIYIYTVYI